MDKLESLPWDAPMHNFRFTVVFEQAYVSREHADMAITHSLKNLGLMDPDISIEDLGEIGNGKVYIVER